MTHRLVKKTVLVIGAALVASALVSQRDQSPDAEDAREAILAHQQLRVEAARASLDAKPLIGESHLPAYDAEVGIAREEAVLTRLSLLRQASR